MPINREQLAELLKPETLRRNADSLPVLAAFQEFLDVERSRTRARMRALTALFLAVFLLAVVAASVVGVIVYNKTQTESAVLRAGLENLRGQFEGTQDGAMVELVDLKTRADRLETTLQKQRNAFEIEKKGISARWDGLSTNLADLNGTIARLQNENAQLHTHLTATATDWDTITNRLEQILLSMAQPPLSTAGTPHPRQDGPLREQPAPFTRHGESQRSIVLAIVPEGGARAMDWRIPLPPIQE
ncbi:MAG: hypothetical protein HQ523_11975 [Lentisphaerae bacterium]|nr:hypothetical protein [Lentisphaerota bacterium]